MRAELIRPLPNGRPCDMANWGDLRYLYGRPAIELDDTGEVVRAGNANGWINVPAAKLDTTKQKDMVQAGQGAGLNIIVGREITSRPMPQRGHTEDECYFSKDASAETVLEQWARGGRLFMNTIVLEPVADGVDSCFREHLAEFTLERGQFKLTYMLTNIEPSVGQVDMESINSGKALLLANPDGLQSTAAGGRVQQAFTARAKEKGIKIEDKWEMTPQPMIVGLNGDLFPPTGAHLELPDRELVSIAHGFWSDPSRISECENLEQTLTTK